ncbi:BgTH12-04942 [Blumeria graminis f. sp. triticale]|uniref:Bgt-5118 n=3 Tax=Blumeria graminis TaxID=34373 RepID=A0A061HLS0_BLUGR|nr:hypothetical protein BGT96224_5118 [Blumeria graminis f. sp. tritici 96224]CAD6502349.1 BgTH12-04942 [Blumeria graminis f. sp. triticale]VDB87602.1 Bgt-5118 [Blumeria graminis f. sp. tritici]
MQRAINRGATERMNKSIEDRAMHSRSSARSNSQNSDHNEPINNQINKMIATWIQDYHRHSFGHKNVVTPHTRGETDKIAMPLPTLTSYIPERNLQLNSLSTTHDNLPDSYPENYYHTPNRTKQGMAIMPSASTESHRGSSKMVSTGIASWFTGNSNTHKLSDLTSKPSWNHRRSMVSSLSNTKYDKNISAARLGNDKSLTMIDRCSEDTPIEKSLVSDIEKAIKSSSPHECQQEEQNDEEALSIRDLLISAEGLLLRLQIAYEQQTSALREMTVSRDKVALELEKSNIQSRNLQAQIEKMISVESLQDQRIAELEREVYEKSSPCLSIFSHHTSHELQRISNSHTSGHTNDSFPACQQNYIHARSTDIDSGQDSDIESGAGDSVFSRPRSPALSYAPSLRESVVDSPSPLSPKIEILTESCTNMVEKKVVEQPQRTLFGFLSNRTNKEVGLAESGCPNCNGKDVSVAWDTAALLRAENTGLKVRIETLEDGVDAALRAIYGDN